MSVDCGLPDFRSDQGIISKMLKVEKSLDYREIVNPLYFELKPDKFWYIYGDRFNQYSESEPHTGYFHLLDICN